MTHVTTEVLAGLLKPTSAPAISLYQPTHRAHPDNQQDPIRYKNLVTRVERSLAEKYPGREVGPLLKPLRELQDDHQFWNRQEDGLAVFRTADSFAHYRLQRPVEELAVVAESFHVKPIVRIVQSADRFQILWLDRENFRVFEGNRDALDEVDLGGLASNVKDALGVDPAESHQTTWGRGGHVVHQGQGGRKDEIRNDTERFFRYVDREVAARFSKPSKQPLLLAALPEHQGEFRRISRNPALVSEAIAVDPGALTVDELRKRAWKAVEPAYLARLAALKDEFHAADAAGKAVSRVIDAAREAADGRLGTLLIEAGRIVPGRMDLKTGKVDRLDSIDAPDVDDLLDDLAEVVLKAGGDVVVVPADLMPTDSGLAALLRF